MVAHMAAVVPDESHDTKLEPGPHYVVDPVWPGKSERCTGKPGHEGGMVHEL